MGANVYNENLKERKAQLEPVLEIYNTYVQTKADNDYLSAVYGMTENYNTTLYNVIDELERKMPSNIEVDSLNVTQTGLIMTFSVATKEEAAAVVVNMRTFESFSDVQMMSIQNTETEVDDNGNPIGDPRVEAQVICTYGENPYLAPEEDAGSDNAEQAE